MSAPPNTPSERDLELLSAYLDGELSDRDKEAIDQRLVEDASLREALNDLRGTVLLVRQLPRLKAPRSFALDPAIYTPKQPWWKQLWTLGTVLQATGALGAAAAVLLVAAAFFATGTGDQRDASAPAGVGYLTETAGEEAELPAATGTPAPAAALESAVEGDTVQTTATQSALQFSSSPPALQGTPNPLATTYLLASAVPNAMADEAVGAEMPAGEFGAADMDAAAMPGEAASGGSMATYAPPMPSIASTPTRTALPRTPTAAPQPQDGLDTAQEVAPAMAPMLEAEGADTGDGQVMGAQEADMSGLAMPPADMQDDAFAEPAAREESEPVTSAALAPTATAASVPSMTPALKASASPPPSRTPSPSATSTVTNTPTPPPTLAPTAIDVTEEALLYREEVEASPESSDESDRNALLAAGVILLGTSLALVAIGRRAAQRRQA